MKSVVFGLAIAAALVSGCDRLSEKDKMEMIAKCDSESRKKIKEQTSVIGNLITTTVVETHYSFSDKTCYALETSTDNIPMTMKVLYDGLTKRELLMTVSGKRGSDGGGYSSGPLTIEGVKNDRGVVSYDEGSKIIEERMKRP